MKLQKIGVAAFFVVIIALGGASIVYTQYLLRHDKSFLADGPTQVKRSEKAQGQTITVMETKDGSRKWVLHMNEIHYTRNNQVARLVGVNGAVYGERQKVVFTFKAPSGYYYKKNNRIVLEKGARMSSPDADVVISAPRMEWSSDSDRVQATGGVQMAKKGFGMSKANKAVFTMDFSRIEFSGNATTMIGSR